MAASVRSRTPCSVAERKEPMRFPTEEPHCSRAKGDYLANAGNGEGFRPGWGMEIRSTWSLWGDGGMV
jgi:hypothetical protein